MAPQAGALGGEDQVTSRPTTQYCEAWGGQVAYQVFGRGPHELVFVGDGGSHLEMLWDEPLLAEPLRRLSTFARIAMFDKNGTGVSERVPRSEWGYVEHWMDDMDAVISAAGFERPYIVGHAEGGPIALMYAATAPHRVGGLILADTFASFLRREGYPFGVRPEQVEKFLEVFELGWGTGLALELVAPTYAASPALREWFARYERSAVSPRVARQLYSVVFDLDLRTVAPSIEVPTTVLHRAGNRHVRVEHGRWLANAIPGARYVELPGDDHAWWSGETEALIAEIQAAVTGERPQVAPTRILSTVLFADLVGSTERAVAVGDRRWVAMLDSHDDAVRTEVSRHRGQVVDAQGDGWLATFDGPARGVRCALAIRDRLAAGGIDVRSGLHTGEIDLRSRGIGGLAVHIGARVSSLAGPGEVLVSRTVKDLVAGSGLAFAERGRHVLKGVPDEWQLFAAEDQAAVVAAS